MNELQVFTHGTAEVVDSREVARMVERPHNDLLKSIRSYCEYLGQGDFSQSDFFIPSTYLNIQNKEQPCYLLTKKGCDMVANKMTGEKGVLFTAAYVTAFERMRERLSPQLMPPDYPSALRALADSVEKLQAIQTQVEKDKPKVVFADAVSTSKTSILVGELAKLLKQNGVDMGQNRLFEWLRGNGYLIRRKGNDYNMPTQKAMELGLFEIKETAISHSDGHTSVNKTPKVTGKGQQYFVNTFLAAQRNNPERRYPHGRTGN